MPKKIVHTCYGCRYYYSINKDGEKEYLAPHSLRHCDIHDVWDCDYFANDGHTNVCVKFSGGNENGKI